MCVLGGLGDAAAAAAAAGAALDDSATVFPKVGGHWLLSLGGCCRRCCSHAGCCSVAAAATTAAAALVPLRWCRRRAAAAVVPLAAALLPSPLLLLLSMAPDSPAPMLPTLQLAEELRPFFCLDLSYAHTLLTKGFKIPDQAQVCVCGGGGGWVGGGGGGDAAPWAAVRAAAACAARSCSDLGGSPCPCGRSSWCSAGTPASHFGPPTAPSNPLFSALRFLCVCVCVCVQIQLVKKVEYNGEQVEAAWPLGAAINSLG